MPRANTRKDLFSVLNDHFLYFHYKHLLISSFLFLYYVPSLPARGATTELLSVKLLRFIHRCFIFISLLLMIGKQTKHDTYNSRGLRSPRYDLLLLVRPLKNAYKVHRYMSAHG
jgi:hypothetical protein